MSYASIPVAAWMNSSSDRFQLSGAGTLLKRIEFGSVAIIPYVLAIVWQYFCTLPNKPLAWTLAAVTALLVWLTYLSLTEASAIKLPHHFWLLVGLPLLFFFLLRLPFPDISFDVLNYHILHSERALRGPLLTSRDFFPTPAPFNPTPDIVTGLYRYALGYRLGPVVNFVALIWTGTILSRLLRDWIKPQWLQCLTIFFVLATEQSLFQINNYMVDLLALPLLLEATLLAINLNPAGNRIVARTLQLAFLLGMAAAFKLANLIYAVPIVLIYIFNVARDKKSIWRLAKAAPVGSLIFALSLLPFTILIYRLTGNPVFPLYNGLFKSPYWPQGAAFDPRWGPHVLIETITWPVVVLFRPDRLSEYGFYSGRLSIGFVIAVAVLGFAWRHRIAWQVAFITLFGLIVWSASSGYIRYALYLELTSGILIVWLVSFAWKKLSGLRTWRAILITPFALLLLLQLSLALLHGYKWEWSARATIFDHRLRYDLREAGNILRDRSLSTYLAPEDLQALDQVDSWVETTYKTSAVPGLLNPEAPATGVRLGEYFLTPTARSKFHEVMDANRGQRTFTLTDRENYEKALDELAARSLTMGSPRPVSIYYFSRALKFDLLLAEVTQKIPEVDKTTGAIEKGRPLPDNAFVARLSVAHAPATMRVGEKYELRVALKNESTVTWPGRQPTWQYQLTIGNRWLNQSGGKVNDVDGRAALFEDLSPDATVELPLTITAPKQPGMYILQIDAIQEGVAWFGDRGSEILSLKIKVE